MYFFIYNINIIIVIGVKQKLTKSISTFNKGINLGIVYYSGEHGLTVSLTLEIEGPQGISINILNMYMIFCHRCSM